jgi:hypothetical protein
MTRDERDQLLEDIKRCNRKREEIVERAQTDAEFDLVLAWEDILALDQFINARLRRDRDEDV